MKYVTSYHSANGQPANGEEFHETFDAALAAWESNIGSLLALSGGDSTLVAWAVFDADYAKPLGSISWCEHCEGGYVSADGIWADEVGHLARYEEENGETLTAAKLVRHLS